MQNGQLPKYATATITVTPTTVSIGAGTESASQVTVNYPFDFIVLDPIARLATGRGTGTSLNMVAQATMRNEM
jgi:hypothetical protein